MDKKGVGFRQKGLKWLNCFVNPHEKKKRRNKRPLDKLVFTLYLTLNQLSLSANGFSFLPSVTLSPPLYSILGPLTIAKNLRLRKEEEEKQERIYLVKTRTLGTVFF